MDALLQSTPTPSDCCEALVDAVERAADELKLRVRYEATTWPARLLQPLAEADLVPGQPVKVLGREGIVLLVAL